MKLSSLLLVVLLSAATSFGVMKYAGPASTAAAPAKETAFERVMRTGTIRCAYTIRPPHMIIDANTKQLSGIDHDILEEIGKAAGLKVIWQDEVGFGVFPEQLAAGKQDAFCSLAMITARRAARAELTIPVTFLPLHAYAREDDLRFENNLSAIDTSETIVAVTDGSSQKAATDSIFPNAKRFSLPGDSEVSQMMMAVTLKKADVVILEDNVVHEFNTRNPDSKLRRIANTTPLRTYPEAFAVGKNETALRDLLSAALQELAGNGIIDKIINKYEIVPGSVLRVALPYSFSP